MVMLIAILSAIALPQIRSQRTEAVISTLKANVEQVTMVVEVQKQKGEGQGYPTTIEPDWFVSGMLPTHPDQMAGVPPIETVRLPGQAHPGNKLVEPGCAGAYWYNVSGGFFRARVKAQPSTAETLDMYNQVNQCGLSSLADISGAAIADGEPSSDGGAASAAPPPSTPGSPRR